MKKYLFQTLVLIAITMILYAVNGTYPQHYLDNLFYSVLGMTILHVIFKIVLEESAVKKLKAPRTRYSMRKTVNILYFCILLLIFGRIWIDDTQTFALTTALVAAGIAIALQDLFKNFMGGLIIFITGPYRIGDRIEINSKHGDVIDIGILYTTLLELREWVESDQPTGRLTIIPNGFILTGMVNNYTKDNNFIWDEIHIPITYGSDWKEAYRVIKDIVTEETRSISKVADEEILQLSEKYFLDSRSVEPEIFLTLTDNWISFHIRYVTGVRTRRFVSDRLSRGILDTLSSSDTIKIASTTMDISAFPEVKVRSTMS